MPRVFTFDNQSSVIWPSKCVVCCGEVDKPTTATVRGISHPAVQPWIFLGVVKYKNLALSYPVCEKHKRTSFFFSIAQLFAVIIMVGGLLGMASSAPGSASAFVGVAIIATGGVALYFSIVRSPIRIGLKDNKDLVVKISNRLYATEFEHINREALVGYADLAARGLR